MVADGSSSCSGEHQGDHFTLPIQLASPVKRQHVWIQSHVPKGVNDSLALELFFPPIVE